MKAFAGRLQMIVRQALEGQRQMATQTTFTDDVIDLLPKMRAYARALTRNVIDADDLVQETLTRALRYHDRYTEGTQLKAWLFTIMRNTHYTDVKKRTRERPGIADCVSSAVTVAPTHDIVIAHKEVIRAIDRLPLQYRETLVLVAVLGESYETAAALCNCPMGTIKSRINRARRMILDDLNLTQSEAAEIVQRTPETQIG